MHGGEEVCLYIPHTHTTHTHIKCTHTHIVYTQTHTRTQKKQQEEAMTQRISDAYLDKQSQVLFPPASVRITDKADDDLPMGYTPAAESSMVNRGGQGGQDDVASHPVQQYVGEGVVVYCMCFDVCF